MRAVEYDNQPSKVEVEVGSGRDVGLAHVCVEVGVV